MTKNMKRIHKVTIKRMIDESPDTSWLGEYGNRATSDFSIDRAHDRTCPLLSAFLNREQSFPNREQFENLVNVITQPRGEAL